MMKDRIVKFLTKNGLSSTRFADEIGVQRSSISHILSGRNKPSYDFIEKMLTAYPNLNAQWLILGKGAMYLNEYIEKSDNFDLFTTVTKSKFPDQIPENPKIEEKSDMDVENVIDTSLNANNSKVERIVVFFNNGLFKEYLPSK